MLSICKRRPEFEKERGLLLIEERAEPFPSVGLTGGVESVRTEREYC